MSYRSKDTQMFRARADALIRSLTAPPTSPGWVFCRESNLSTPVAQESFMHLLSHCRARGMNIGHLQGSNDYVLLPSQYVPLPAEGGGIWQRINDYVNQHGYIPHAVLAAAGLKGAVIQRWETAALARGYTHVAAKQEARRGTQVILWRDWQRRSAPLIQVASTCVLEEVRELLRPGGYGEACWQEKVLATMAREPQRYGARAVMARFYQACVAENIACPVEFAPALAPAPAGGKFSQPNTGWAARIRATL